MTSPPRAVECECRTCGERWTDYVRASINLSLGEEWTEEEIEEATSVRCPGCGATARTGALVVGHARRPSRSALKSG